MATQTHKAFVVSEIGKQLSLIHDRPTPKPGPDQVLLRVLVSGPNPHDQKARDRGLFIADHLPAVLNQDVVGEVIALGSNVNKYAIGDHIVSHAGFDGKYTQSGLQEYAIADAAFSAKIPEGSTDDDGATLPTNVIAPLFALFADDTLGIPAPWTGEAKSFDYKGTTLLVIGGGSNCGRFGVQLAAIAGIGQIVVVGGDEAELKSYGATDVIDRHGTTEELVKRIRDVVGDDLIYAYDAVNQPAGQLVGINALSTSKKGKIARLVRGGEALDESKVNKKSDAYEVKNVFGSSQVKPDIAEPFWERVPQYLKEGKLKAPKYEAVDLKDWNVTKVNDLLDAYRDDKRVTKTHFHLA